MSRRRILSAAVLLLGALVLGCQNGSLQMATPVSPNSESIDDGYWVGIDGDTLYSGFITLIIPPHALGGDTYITVHQGSGGITEFGPSGTTFGVPVTLIWDASNHSNPSALSVKWWDPATQTWVTMPSTHDGSMITTEIEHFSRFTLG